MGKCQIVDCGEQGEAVEVWTVGNARAFVTICGKHGLHSEAGARSAVVNGAIVRREGHARRQEIA